MRSVFGRSKVLDPVRGTSHRDIITRKTTFPVPEHGLFERSKTPDRAKETSHRDIAMRNTRFPRPE